MFRSVKGSHSQTRQCKHLQRICVSRFIVLKKKVFIFAFFWCGMSYNISYRGTGRLAMWTFKIFLFDDRNYHRKQSILAWNSIFSHSINITNNMISGELCTSRSVISNTHISYLSRFWKVMRIIVFVTQSASSIMPRVCCCPSFGGSAKQA